MRTILTLLAVRQVRRGLRDLARSAVLGRRADAALARAKARFRLAESLAARASRATAPPAA